MLTVDQTRSRAGPDRVDEALALLAEVPTVLTFTRTVGDEFQGLLDDPVSVLDAILVLVRDSSWHVGLGLGPVDRPLPAADPRRGRGEAFLAARDAVEHAKNDPLHLAVVAPDRAAPEAADVKAAGPGWPSGRCRKRLSGLTHPPIAPPAAGTR